MHKRRAILIGAYHNRITREVAEQQLEELKSLVDTYGAEIADTFIFLFRQFIASTLISTTKIEEIAERARELEANLIIFDNEITPAQQRNLEKLLGMSVMDRTEVILEVFAQRAQTKEARVQIELARVKYMSPRLKRLWTHLSREAGTSGAGGGGAYLKGMGEKQIEIDRRLLKENTNKLRRDLEEIREYRETQRAGRLRSGIPTFALIGYTNVGKSTLLNALTDAGVFVEDKLFATLDTTTRKMTLRNGQEILLIDTVGFIRNLPHLLVAAFKSTLDEAIQADILLHVVDTSHPQALEQARTTFEVLKELKADARPVITLLNKIDLCKNSEMAERLRLTYPKTVKVSGLERTGFEQLEELMLDELRNQRKRLSLRIPQADYGVVSEIMRLGHVIEQDYEENDVSMVVEVPVSLAGRLSRYIKKNGNGA